MSKCQKCCFSYGKTTFLIKMTKMDPRGGAMCQNEDGSTGGGLFVRCKIFFILISLNRKFCSEPFANRFFYSVCRKADRRLRSKKQGVLNCAYRMLKIFHFFSHVSRNSVLSSHDFSFCVFKTDDSVEEYRCLRFCAGIFLSIFIRCFCCVCHD